MAETMLIIYKESTTASHYLVTLIDLLPFSSHLSDFAILHFCVVTSKRSYETLRVEEAALS